ncbi:cysteine hydrolase [Pediococcus pentosaceus]|uniref:cysteine hydrolase family protein n=1 Tax=Pediococcus pentosaceus TaxID=1255 RepID=UPI00223A933D|nr:cysteine hydrolase family protein [Pediococcus pentosaceus]MCT1178680.1 cysteine hydrolase [Pediococcus pentosaceus]
MIFDVLLVIDLQNGVCHSNDDITNLDSLVNDVNMLIEKYRTANRPIIFVQHNGIGIKKNSTEWQLVPELHQQATDIFVDKTHANSFYHTQLLRILDENEAQSIEICGAQTEYCVDATVKFAHGLGYQLQMKSGTTSTYNNSYMTALRTIKFFEGIWKNHYLRLY